MMATVERRKKRSGGSGGHFESLETTDNKTSWKRQSKPGEVDIERRV
jgi:hypothetical protein